MERNIHVEGEGGRRSREGCRVRREGGGKGGDGEEEGDGVRGRMYM